MITTIEQKVALALETLKPRQLTEEITVYGGHYFRTVVQVELLNLWAEEVRVRDKTSGQSMMYRVISREGIQHTLRSDGVKPIVVVDNVPNVEAELQGGLYDSSKLPETYKKLAEGGIDLLLKPIREGSLGINESIAEYGPFRSTRSNESAQDWDTQEELIFAHAIIQALQPDVNMTDMKQSKEIIDETYLHFALPFIHHLDATWELLHTTIMDEWLNSAEIDPSFSELQPKEMSVDLGAGDVAVEQLVAYPYVTAKGALYIRLFCVWDENRQSYESVRVIQTQPKGWAAQRHYAGMRIDSGCHDGMHSRDSHCDCHQQLLDVIEDGQRRQEDRVIVQLMDHEGKGWGTVWKGATLQIMRAYNQQAGSTGEVPIGNPQASAALYNALGEPHDRRDYRAAEAVIKALGISSVDTLLMGNQEKVAAVQIAGVQFGQMHAVDVQGASHEAELGLGEKKQGTVVVGSNGNIKYM